jgi:hypothetical protein
MTEGLHQGGVVTYTLGLNQSSVIPQTSYAASASRSTRVFGEYYRQLLLWNVLCV